MKYEQYEFLRIRVERGVAFVSIHHPPMNLLDLALLKELGRLLDDVQGDEAIRVLVFESADPDFFLAHYNMQELLTRPVITEKTKALKPFYQLLERYRTLPQVTIARIDGCVRGAGSEFVLALDMRFASSERAVFGQLEVSLGIIPGGAATQRLPRLIGRARALEVILGSQDFDAQQAERYGWVNRTLPQSELGPFVEQLAFRMASFSPVALRLAKQAVDAGQRPFEEGLLEESYRFEQSLGSLEGRRRMTQFLASGGQTRSREMSLEWVTGLSEAKEFLF